MTTKREILDLAKKQDVTSLRLQFTDILGVNKNVEVPESQFDKALEGDIMFDGSSIEGFVRIEESDMVLRPDLDTFRVLPNGDAAGKVGRVICDIYNPDGSSFAGCTRQALQRQIAQAKSLGYEMMAGVEAEFFIFQLDADGEPTTVTHDRRGISTRCELRMPAPSANPYLALAVQLAAGLDGVERKLTPPDPVNKNIFEMSYRERRKHRIDELPRDLHEALDMLEKDDVVRDALGPHIYERFVEAKREEWQEYIGRVSEWEVERYLAQY